MTDRPAPPVRKLLNDLGFPDQDIVIVTPQMPTPDQERAGTVLGDIHDANDLARQSRAPGRVPKRGG